MGFFSWKTADTSESIPNEYSGRKMRTVYLLQPNGHEPIAESCYEGYGWFGGVDAYVWLGRMNAEFLGLNPRDLTDDELRSMGIALECGTVHRDRESGVIWHVFHDNRAIIGGTYFPGTYGEIIPAIGMSANEAIKAGRLITVKVSELANCRYPLKFSFRKDAVYEELPPSENCPSQGYFFDEE